MKKNISYLIGSFLGVGYVPKASGTFGSLVALPLAYFLINIGGVAALLVGICVCFLSGVLASAEILKYTEHDPSLIVIDEVAGQLLSFVFVANLLTFGLGVNAYILYLFGFVFFRFFDILKPGLIGRIDRKMENAWGVMLDDVVAGLYASLAVVLCALCLM